MQDPNEDTEWNDILRKKGIIPQKEPTEAEISEDTIVQLMEDAIRAKSGVKDLEDMTLDELNENEDDVDEEEERIFQAYRQQRLAEMKAANQKACYGSVLEISKADYVREVNQAGEGVWVVLHVYKNSTPLCKLLNEHMTQLSQKFPDVKFIRSESSVCIPNYPDKNLPTIFVYHEGDMKKQWIGTASFGGMGFTRDDFEWMLSQASVLKTTLEENPRKQVQDVMTSAIRGARVDADSGDEDDW